VKSNTHEMTCWTCYEYLGDEYDPQPCCSGHMCGCRGLPTNPPFCSPECMDNYGKVEKRETLSNN